VPSFDWQTPVKYNTNVVHCTCQLCKLVQAPGSEHRQSSDNVPLT